MIARSYSIQEVNGTTYAEARPSVGSVGAEMSAEMSAEIPIVLLHGMMGDIDNWETVFAPVSEAGFRVLCPILPVYSLPLRKASLQGVVDFVAKFLDDLGIARAFIAGNSLGGHVAAMFAMQHPERVVGLVLTGASGIYEVEMSTSIMRRKDREYLRPRVSKTFFDPRHCTEELLDDVIEIINNREKAIRLIKFARSVDNNPIKNELHRILAPTLLVWGKNDEITPPDIATTFEAGIEDSELQWLDECGHVPMMEQPTAFAELLVGFLNRIALPVQGA